MTDTCATSNEYADFIVNYAYDPDTIEQKFSPACTFNLNQKYAVVYKQLSAISNLSVSTYGYSAFPKCYTIMDTGSIESTNALRLRNQPGLELRGSGVITAFIDTGIDYTNNIFINSDNTSRISVIWDQTATYYPENYLNAPYGRVYTNENLNEALANSSPLSIADTQDEIGHGTFMAGIAAGNEDFENDFTGMAPDCDIAVVKLKPAKQYLKDYYFIPDDAICYQENDIMLAINFLINYASAQKKPIVIYIGVGTNSGDHNGRSFLEEYISYYSTINAVAFVSAAGNEVNLGHHFQKLIPYSNTKETLSEEVELRIGENNQGFTMELWNLNPNTASLTFISPSGEFFSTTPRAANYSDEFNFLFDNTTIYTDSFLLEDSTGDQLTFMRFRTPSTGIWRIIVETTAESNGTFHIWLPCKGLIDEDTQFLSPEPDVTLCSPSNALYIIAVSGYNHRNNSQFINSSRGFTVYGNIKPDIAAPAVDVFGPFPDNTFGTMTGTSIAAAHTAGAIALLLEWAVVKQNQYNINSLKIHKYLILGASRLPVYTFPNREYGYGFLDIYNTFESLRSTI